MTIANPNLRKLLAEPDIASYAKILAEIPPGWYTNPELAWRVAGPDPDDRADFYELVDALVEAGKLHCISAWHNKHPLRVFQIEFDRLRMLFAAAGVE